MSSLREYLDLVGFLLFISITFYVYFQISQIWGIYMVMAMIIVIGISYVPGLLRSISVLRYRNIVKVLKREAMIREPLIIRKSGLPSGKVHTTLYKLSKIWKLEPMVVFVKNYYLYISSELSNKIFRKIRDFYDSPNEKNIITLERKKEIRKKNRKQLINLIMDEFPFENKQEVEVVLSKIQDEIDF